MSFFSDPKNAGLAFMIIGVIGVVLAIITIVLGLINYEVELGDKTYKFGIAVAVGAIGSIIFGCMQFGYGKIVRNNPPAKIDILAMFVKLVGVGTIVLGIFNAIEVIIDNFDNVGTGLVGAIISIVIGLIIIWIGTKINDGKQTIGDKIIWIILLVVFVLSLIAAVLEILTIVGIITGICDLIIYVFMIILLFDAEVKKEMGI